MNDSTNPRGSAETAPPPTIPAPTEANAAPPRTPTARNALKHGLTSANFCLLDDEDKNLFNEHRTSIELALAPRNVIEAIHVARIVESSWLIFRASLIEAKAISASMELSKANWIEKITDATEATAALKAIGGEYLCFQAFEDLETRSKVLDKLTRYRTTQERSFHKNLAALQKLRGPGRPLLEILPTNSLATLNSGQSLFDVKPPAPPQAAPPAPPPPAPTLAPAPDLTPAPSTPSLTVPTQPTDSKPEIENYETKPAPPKTPQTPPFLFYT